MRVRNADDRGKRRKLEALAIVIILIAASGAFVWWTQFRSWNIEELAAQVINDPTAAAPGFDHGLAGKTITVHGKVTWLETHPTTQGNLTFFSLDHAQGPVLAFWGEPPFAMGDHVSRQLSFEWSQCNDEMHVYSPQVGFPALQMMPYVALGIRAVSTVAGTVLVTSISDLGDIVITVADQVERLPLGNLSCTLNSGMRSWAGDYIESMGFTDPNNTYGREVDHILSLAAGEGSSGSVRFVDADLDGNLSTGDRFEIRDLETPQSESGMRSYLLSIKIPFKVRGLSNVPSCVGSYFVINSRGLLMLQMSPGYTPYARMQIQANETEAVGSLVSVVGRASWDELSLRLSDSVNEASWRPPQDALSSGSTAILDLGFRTIGGLDLDCEVMDLLGNGRIDVGDSITISTFEGMTFSPTRNYTLIMIYEPTGEWINNNADNSFHT